MSDGEEGKTVPQVMLGVNDTQVVDNILMGIIGYLRNSPRLTPQTVKRIQELEGLRVRLLFVLHGGENNAVFLTVDDIKAIREAMITFVYITRRIVPQSKERDETLETVSALRKHIEKHLLP
jgi:hypothetical protein